MVEFRKLLLGCYPLMRVIECISFNRMLDYDVNKTIKLETAVKIGRFLFEGWGKIFQCNTANM